MTKVYVVMYRNYEQTWPNAVFSTEAAAEACAARRNVRDNNYAVYDFDVREDDGTADADESSRPSFDRFGILHTPKEGAAA